MTTTAAERHRVKVSVTVDPALLKAVDAYVERHEGLDRSKVFNLALLLWYSEQQEQEIAAQHEAPQSEAERRERDEWRRIRHAAAARTLREY